MSKYNAITSLQEFLELSLDYVVVGGGTAGLVLAARLTEDPLVTVGVIEAGNLRLGDENVESMGGNSKMLHNPEYDWVFKTTPQKQNGDKIHHLARGKLLGGSSGVNFMAYVRPTSEDIDAWASVAPGWSWDSLEPFFLKNEALLSDQPSKKRPDHFVLDPKYHGNSGPVAVSWLPSPFAIDEAVVKALGDVAVPCQHKDPYSGQHLGMSQHLSTVDRRNKQVKRSYAATGYLQPALGRENLHVLTAATACKVTLDTVTGRATAVNFLHGRHVYSVQAKRDIILSASTIQSPRLLELSGIGNPEILKKAGVSCLINLPEVGENLHEHPLSVVTYELVKSPENLTLDTVLADPEVLQSQLRLLMEKQEGSLAGAGGLIGFMPYAPQVPQERLTETLHSITASQLQLNSLYRRQQSERVMRLLRDPNAPVIEVVGMPCNFDIAAGGANQSRLIPGPPPGSGGCYSLLISPVYTMSRGSTHIVPPQAGHDLQAEPPEIDIAIMAHAAEVDVLAAAVTMADRAFRSRHLASRTLRRIAPPEGVNLEDVTQARQYVQDNVMIFNHNGGTCAMGRVVDERLRVKGVPNLRVVDCSVIPDQIAANPLATVYALAERAADLIKEDYRS